MLKRAVRFLYSAVTLLLALANVVLGIMLGLVVLLGDKLRVHPVDLAGRDFWGTLCATALMGAVFELGRRLVALRQGPEEEPEAPDAAAQGDTEASDEQR